MKHILLYLFIVSISVAATPPLQPEGWPLATVFPYSPKVTESPPSNGCSYLGRAEVKKDGVSYGLQRLVFEHRPNDIPGGQQSTKLLMMKLNEGRLLEEENVVICGLPGLRYVIENKNGSQRAEFRDVVLEIDGRFEDYLFKVSYDAHQPITDDIAAFLEHAEIRANQALLPTTTSVTAPAGQEPRQP